ncbi:BZ3500_MvSof-1268-A1-R1_Chr1-2g01300 [Microbotryum saponariae]|uniref:BZ3500_MvSof-1268-A1-R1_Chr1-2g01300 protein n=1 Tax=Microbotryum saponariae TaxID=289078 RepID=A0A2X0KD59_9BASI|nr:BZ3500_MvSof-1268-A1-R1_Chr1-2g01300 [Microbotryum saponariae]SCZ97017.1 BZ3501_MvSof-1269-A2-R1_Chr1-2g00898 [Microbotryum saponariae]
MANLYAQQGEAPPVVGDDEEVFGADGGLVADSAGGRVYRGAEADLDSTLRGLTCDSSSLPSWNRGELESSHVHQRARFVQHRAAAETFLKKDPHRLSMVGMTRGDALAWVQRMQDHGGKRKTISSLSKVDIKLLATNLNVEAATRRLPTDKKLGPEQEKWYADTRKSVIDSIWRMCEMKKKKDGSNSARARKERSSKGSRMSRPGLSRTRRQTSITQEASVTEGADPNELNTELDVDPDFDENADDPDLQNVNEPGSGGKPVSDEERSRLLAEIARGRHETLFRRVPGSVDHDGMRDVRLKAERDAFNFKAARGTGTPAYRGFCIRMATQPLDDPEAKLRQDFATQMQETQYHAAVERRADREEIKADIKMYMDSIDSKLDAVLKALAGGPFPGTSSSSAGAASTSGPSAGVVQPTPGASSTMPSTPFGANGAQAPSASQEYRLPPPDAFRRDVSGRAISVPEIMELARGPSGSFDWRKLLNNVVSPPKLWLVYRPKDMAAYKTIQEIVDDWEAERLVGKNEKAPPLSMLDELFPQFETERRVVENYYKIKNNIVPPSPPRSTRSSQEAAVKESWRKESDIVLGGSTKLWAKFITIIRAREYKAYEIAQRAGRPEVSAVARSEAQQQLELQFQNAKMSINQFVTKVLTNDPNAPKRPNAKKRKSSEADALCLRPAFNLDLDLNSNKLGLDIELKPKLKRKPQPNPIGSHQEPAASKERATARLVACENSPQYIGVAPDRVETTEKTADVVALDITTSTTTQKKRARTRSTPKKDLNQPQRSFTHMAAVGETTAGNSNAEGQLFRHPAANPHEECYNSFVTLGNTKQLARAIEGAIEGHGQLWNYGFVHRDVSYGNVMVS